MFCKIENLINDPYFPSSHKLKEMISVWYFSESLSFNVANIQRIEDSHASFFTCVISSQNAALKLRLSR